MLFVYKPLYVLPDRSFVVSSASLRCAEDKTGSGNQFEEYNTVKGDWKLQNNSSVE